MSNQLKTVFITVILALAYVLTDVTSAMAFGLDPSEIKIGQIVRMVPAPVWGVGGIIIAWKLKRVITWIFADGHVEQASSTKDDNNQ
ncbi:hypothetical protein IID19_02795 [Patescibacteria group bacterium]|nr:hypothetical protein [Patescibacteria group bacterium]